MVTDIAGTTRDTLEEKLSLGGITLKVVDTAGIRDTEDVVERMGVDRARKAAADADLIIYVVDASRPLDENDRDIMAFIRDKKAVVLLNKTDLQVVISPEELENALSTNRLVGEVLVREKGGVIEAEIYPDPDYVKKKRIKDVRTSLQEVIDEYNRTAAPQKKIYSLVVRETEFEKTPSKKIKRY